MPLGGEEESSGEPHGRLVFRDKTEIDGAVDVILQLFFGGKRNSA